MQRSHAALIALVSAVGCSELLGVSFDVEPREDGSGARGGAGGEAGGGGVGEGGAGGSLDPCVLDLAVRKHTSCAVMRGGRLWCWGEHGGLVQGSAGSRDLPAPFSTDGVSQVGVGEGFIVIAFTDGTVQTIGENGSGELGIGTTGSRVLTPQPVDVQDVSEIAVGRSHTCALSVDGVVSCWGDNRDGQIALSPAMQTVPTPTVVTAVEAKRIAAGARHSCAIRTDNAMVCWGSNTMAQVGLAPSAYEAPTALMTFADDLVLGGAHSCVLSDGDAECWGWNTFQQLGSAGGMTDSMPRYVALDGTVVGLHASGRRTCARLESGVVSCWGDSGLGAPGDQTPIDVTVPEPDAELRDAGVIALGSYHSCIARPDDSVWCRGRGREGQLGHGFIVDSDLLVQVQLSCE